MIGVGSQSDNIAAEKSSSLLEIAFEEMSRLEIDEEEAEIEEITLLVLSITIKVFSIFDDHGMCAQLI